MSSEGNKTSEFKKSKLVITLSVVLPVLALVCDLLVNNSIATGTAAVIAGLISSAIASAGYSSARGRVKSSQVISESMLVKKKD
tara:strand:+ start:20994 stop:21245 length:252 start_codon:yes stop_codon:yes gene_type:complete